MGTAAALDPAVQADAQDAASWLATGARRGDLEVVADRAARRARPRVVLAVLTTGGLGCILVAQLLLSIGTEAEAYSLNALQKTSTELGRERSVQVEAIQRLAAPQALAKAAVKLGMVPSISSAYLRLGDGAVLGSAVPAGRVAAVGTGAVADALLPASH